MASLANQTISSTYDGLIKTSTDNAVGASGVQALQDGSGNTLALSVGRTGNGASVSGNLTISGAILDSSSDTGTAGQILSSTGTGTNWIDAGGGGGYAVSVISTNTNAVNDTLYVLTASLTLTLPASPSVDDKIAVSNMSGTTTPVIARNGNNIQGLAQDLTLDVDGYGFQLVYSGATKGWVLI